MACIHEKNVEQAVIVVVEQRHSAGHGLDQVLAGGGRIAQDEIDTVERRELELRFTTLFRSWAMTESDKRSESRHVRIITVPRAGYRSGILLCSPEDLSSAARGLVSLISAICAIAVLMVLLYVAELGVRLIGTRIGTGLRERWGALSRLHCLDRPGKGGKFLVQPAEFGECGLGIIGDAISRLHRTHQRIWRPG